MKNLIGILLGVLLMAWMFSLCAGAGKNKTGHEYMPDMYHPVSYEANTYSAYSWNHWDDKNEYSKLSLSNPRAKVNGTVPRGYTAAYYGGNMDKVGGKNAPNAVPVPLNGEAPFYYTNTEDERLRCEKEMNINPFPITKAGLDRAKPLYNVYCGVCHGEKGNGEGSLVTAPDSKYPVQPKNLLADDIINAGNGRYYFAIMHGKNLMGNYADKLSFEERWQVIHYIRSLQAKSKSLEYNEEKNTFTSILNDTPGLQVAAKEEAPAPSAEPKKEVDGHGHSH